ncbi:hypothetical protein DL240_01275 [Lujinxingia litoralis]|uniref:Aminotransferase class I/classII large domain-containing protein n=1 Tax=Lujinxingia litoralis TaxID=2211119 RepID=A0A328CD86_9DELT|nr:pyridoxal phosphate-dependent aminotransferase [Lujinxingia litoralis]RAL24869.1 hypothetical protein DL240_01275 [Lujinxingia litoralis]
MSSSTALTPSARARAIEPTLIRMLRARVGAQTLDFGLGQSDQMVSPRVARAARQALSQEARAPYTPNAGLPSAREAVAAHLGCDAAQVMLTCGVQEALAVSLLGLVNPGDEVLVPDPGFPAYANLVRACAATPRRYTLRAPQAPGAPWRVDLDAIAAAIRPETRLIVLNNPANPTAQVFTAGERHALARLIERHDLAWIEDAIYEDYVWSGVFESLGALESMSARGVRISGLSKSHHLMGWRIGWMVAPAETIAALTPLHQHLVTCAPLPAQLGLEAALAEHEEATAAARAIFARRRATVASALGQIEDVGLAEMEGAFYAFMDVRPWLERFSSTLGLAEALLDEQDVLVTPGEGFGPAGAGFLRLAYTPGEPDLSKGLARLVSFLDSHRP